LNYKITSEVADPTKLEEISYGYKYGGMGYTEIITPAGDLLNSTGKGSYTYTASRMSQNLGHQLLLSNETMINVSGNYQRIWNSFEWYSSFFYTKPGNFISIRVQEPTSVTPPQSNLLVTYSESILDNNVYLHKKGEPLLYFTPWEMKMEYLGLTKRIFSYDGDETFFNKYDSKQVIEGSNAVNIIYSNENKDPKSVSIKFTVDNNTLIYKISVNARKPEHLQSITYGYKFSVGDYNKIIVPDGQVLGVTGRSSYDYQATQLDRDYQLMLSDERLLNISSNFNTIWNSMRWGVSHLNTGPFEELTIAIGEINTTRSELGYLLPTG